MINYVNILYWLHSDDKNTLCNGCNLTGRSVRFRVFMFYGLFISSHVIGLLFLEDVHEDSLQNSS
jgi:hypothetical protein